MPDVLIPNLVITQEILVEPSATVIRIETPGISGQSGKSAYEVAVANGFSGSEITWLASLVGTGGSTTVTSGSAIPNSSTPGSLYIRKS